MIKRWLLLGLMVLIAVLLMMLISVITNRVFWLFSIMYMIGSYYTLIALFGAFWNRRKMRTDPSFRPFVTIMVPMKNEQEVILDTLTDLAAQDYRMMGRSRAEILIVDDASTDGSARKVASFIKSGRKRSGHAMRLVHNPGPDHGKPAALNYGLKHARGEVICVFDADARVPKDFISNAVAYFKDPEVCGVQGKVRIYNRYDNTLTEVQDDEFASFNQAVQRSRDCIGGAVALGGNGQLTRASALRKVGGWKVGSITEDLELSVRLYENGWRIRYAEESTVYQEGVLSLKALFRQRTRWSQGHILTFLQMAPRVLMSGRLDLFLKFDLLVYLSGIMTPGFVFLSYLLGSLAFFSLSDISSGVNDLLWIWASVAFIPVIFWGLFREVSRNPVVLLFKSMRIFIFCFHWIPAFIMGWGKTFMVGLANSNPMWDKTRHNGARVVFELYKP